MEKNIILNMPSERLTYQKIIEFVQLNSMFKSDVYLINNNQRFNAKSIISMVGVLLTAEAGKQFIINVKGQNAEKDIDEIIDFFGSSLTHY
ncbi:HPr family phosphocarrier protein [Evansella halocellulosilytica]|uniref:HPr family phosphocarrier protein n=1 Tax=Evansella halocellulosilytica TaxID=2011013 RepID=UPI000BB9A4FD|nr:HPr family phosphocarrier protein [Evansella halocellulosilytica]